ncbi:MAG: ATP-dependent DNA ligase [Fimbriimonadaceae bacterium]|nr:ATP-dependent DNA ligase [Chitinophagales bacterium]
MRLFAALLSNLDLTNKTNERIEVILQYFNSATDIDKLWTIYILSGNKIKRQFTSTQLRTWAIELSGLPQWLFEESYQSVGDLSETIALLLPKNNTHSNYTLHEWVQKIEFASKLDEPQRKEFLSNAWNQLDAGERFAFNKLITGGFRIGVSQKTIINAISIFTNISANILAHRITGKWHPTTISFHELIFEDRIHTDISQPYPFFLAYPIENDVAELGEAIEWQTEWKWDGIRGQMIKRKNELFIWSRGEELVTEKFPEFQLIKNILPDGIVLDGEILCYTDNHPLPFQILQTRIGRKNVTSKILKEAPVIFMIYDMMEFNGEDIREKTLSHRRSLLNQLQIHKPLLLSKEIQFDTWGDLTVIRERSRENFSEGIMLKRKSSNYQVGRKKGDWWKWKVDPYSIDAVLVYAQKGHGRRANLYTDYTFAAWNNENKLVVFTKAYSGLTDKEIQEVDAFIRKNTLEKFGPVRTVTPQLVFEIGFEGIALSSRHKSGVALRFPRILRWRKDKKIEEANTLADLKILLDIDK